MNKRSEPSRSHVRRYVVQGAVAVGVLGLAATGVVLSLPAQANYKATDSKQGDRPGIVEGEATTLAPDTYLGVERLRGELCLTAGHLASMGCSPETSALLLSQTITAYEARRSDVLAARNAVLMSKAELRQAQRRAYRDEAEGQPPTDAQLRGLEAQYERDVASYHQLLETLAAGMAQTLSADQQALWRSARTAERDGRPSERG